MDQKVIGTGLGGLVVGVLLGSIFASGGPDADEIAARVSETVTPATDRVAAEVGDQVAGVNENVSGAVAGLEEQLAALGDRLDGLEAAVNTPAQEPEALGAIQSRLDEMAKSMADSQSAAQSGREEMMSAIGTLGSDMQSAMQTAPAASGGGGEGDDGGEDGAAAAAEGSGGGSGEEAASADAIPSAVARGGTGQALSPGATANFGDGAVRVFVSRIDSEAGSARVSVNGEMTTLTAGQSRMIEGAETTCLITLDEIEGNAAQVFGVCGADMPDPEGVTVGHTQTFGEGEDQVRVFVSSVTDRGARLAVNGVTPQTVAAGDSIPAGPEGCTLTVNAVDRGHVSLSHGC